MLVIRNYNVAFMTYGNIKFIISSIEVLVPPDMINSMDLEIDTKKER